jgi:peptide/nickel transport system substrate-binding protein
LNAENPNKYILIQTLTSVEILPEHVWSVVEEEFPYPDLLEFLNTENPVGSGPYELMYVNSDEGKTIWVRDNNYWGAPYFGLPQPLYIVNIVIPSNEVGNNMLALGEIDWSECFMPNIWELGEGRGTWSTNPPYYMPVPYMTGLIYFNYLQIAGDDALNNPEVRRAMAFAINWATICDVAFARLTTPANPSLLPETVPELAKYINTTAVEQYGWTYNVTRANEILDSEGYPVGAGGWRTYPNDTKIGPYTLLIVEGWTDWEAAAYIVQANLAEVGIDIEISLVEDFVFFTAIETGDFQVTFDQPSTWTPSIPWYTYYLIYCSRTSPAAVTPAYGNWGSYNNTRVDELLDEIAMTSPEDEETLAGLYGELQSIILRELPYIGGWFYGPFYEYSETYWTNWPTENNPYTGAVPYWDSCHGYFPMLFHLKSTTAAIACDVNLDGIVDIADIYIVALAYGATPEQPKYTPNVDINYDGIIDIADIYIAALHYGQMH